MREDFDLAERVKEGFAVFVRKRIGDEFGELTF
jgi:hypothetical protein